MRVGSQNKIRLVRCVQQETNGLTHVVGSNDRDKIEGSQEELNKMRNEGSVVTSKTSPQR